MATLYEYYNAGDDAHSQCYGGRWLGQTFTPAVAHVMTHVKLKLFRTDSPGTLTVAVKATDANGLPTGADLALGTTDGNTLGLGASPTWRQVDLATSYSLDAGVKYAIILKAPDAGMVINRLYWRYDDSDPTYPRGAHVMSLDSGASWTEYPYDDSMFEEYGYTLYCMRMSLAIPYEDLDGTKKLHMVLKNLSPTTKGAGASEEVVIEVGCEPTS